MPGTPIPRDIARMLDADLANQTAAAEGMVRLDPWMLQAFDEEARLFGDLFARLTNWTAEGETQDRLSAIAKKNGLTVDSLIELLEHNKAEAVPDAVIEWNVLWAQWTAKILIAAIKRYWIWGAAELFRFRLSPATGYLRQEAEAIGLICIFLETPQHARDWFDIRTNEQGRKFFKNTQPDVRARIDSHELGRAYEMASQVGQHVRLIGLSRSLHVEAGQMPRLPDQDFDDDFNYCLTVAYFHRTQERVLKAIGSVILGGDPDWAKQLADFSSRVDQLFVRIAVRYPKESHDAAIV